MKTECIIQGIKIQNVPEVEEHYLKIQVKSTWD